MSELRLTAKNVILTTFVGQHQTYESNEKRKQFLQLLMSPLSFFNLFWNQPYLEYAYSPFWRLAVPTAAHNWVLNFCGTCLIHPHIWRHLKHKIFLVVLSNFRFVPYNTTGLQNNNNFPLSLSVIVLTWIYLAKVKLVPCLFKNHAITHVWGSGFILRCIVNKSTNRR